MITYTPESKNKTALVTTVTLILSSLIFMGFSFALNSGSELIAMLAMLFLMLSLLIGERYLNCSYTYILEENDLVIQKNSFRKSTAVCRIEYIGIADITKKRDVKKKEYKAAHNYCKTMFYSDIYCIIFDNGRENAVIYFEPDEYFLSQLKKRTKADCTRLGL